MAHSLPRIRLALISRCCIDWAILGVLFWIEASPTPGQSVVFPTFAPEVIDSHVGEICYAVAAADVDHDGRLDVVAVSERGVYWYQNPDWAKRVIIEDQTVRDNVCIAPLDIDRDGLLDFALGAGWTTKGTIQWLARNNSLDEKWNVFPIGEEPWTHRMRFSDVLGLGTSQLVVSPLNKTVGSGVRLIAFTIPTDPRKEQWRPTVLDDSLNRMHSHWHVDLDDDQSIDTLTASQEGIHLISILKSGTKMTLLSRGSPGDRPEQQGAGEVKTGMLPNGALLIGTIEPMHGNQVVVYDQPKKNEWRRHVLDETLGRGHACWFADLDRNGADELVIGHSDAGSGNPSGPGVFVYELSHDSGRILARKHAIDNGGIATEDMAVADFNQDGWPDIVAGGRATHNVKVYYNRGR